VVEPNQHFWPRRPPVAPQHIGPNFEEIGAP
jgi:hypothetical protein